MIHTMVEREFPYIVCSGRLKGQAFCFVKT